MFVETGQQIYQELIRQRVQRQTWEQTAPTKREGRARRRENGVLCEVMKRSSKQGYLNWKV